jgi:hypothetical protein
MPDCPGGRKCERASVLLPRRCSVRKFLMTAAGGAVLAGYVVSPVGGAGASVISMARTGVQPPGGQLSQKTQIAWALGRAALGASTPRQPSFQSA